MFYLNICLVLIWFWVVFCRIITILNIFVIGGISKTDLKRFIAYAKQNFNLPVLESFLIATPTAELGKSLSPQHSSDP